MIPISGIQSNDAPVIRPGGPMFDRFTEKARRVVFFARKEASESGSLSIESEHMLLALVRDNQGLFTRFLSDNCSEAEIRTAVNRATSPGEPIPTNVDLPLSNECKRILAFSAEEASQHRHRHVDAEHLVIGILREENCLAAKLLRERGLQLDHARAVLVATEKEGAERTAIGSGIGSQRQLTTAIDFVEAESAELLLTYQHGSLIPRIGETILIRKDGTPERSYHVLNVVWEFSWNAAGSVLKDVIVSVAKETE
jgi:ATP-dependent Clp protease ATP-binding subunit ClpC